MKNNLVLLVGLIFLFSCEKEEEPILPFERGEVEIVSINTGNNGDYSKQIFYDLSENKIVKSINRTIWDLGFESTPNGTTVTLNSSNKMQASKTGFNNFDSVTNLVGMSLSYTWDHSTGNSDSIALKDWMLGGVPTNEVFIIDRGVDPNNLGRGFKKLQILSVNTNEYVIKYANIDGSDLNTLTIVKDPTKNNTCFSFNNGGEIVDVEPNKNEWDLLFTHYTYTFYVSNPPLAYLVNGTLLNRSVCKAVKVFDKPFSDININDVANYVLNDTLDVIGYDWKYFDMDASLYVVYPYKNYLIKDNAGFYYKLRFIDFYDDLAVKGTPKFEIVKL